MRLKGRSRSWNRVLPSSGSTLNFSRDQLSFFGLCRGFGGGDATGFGANTGSFVGSNVGAVVESVFLSLAGPVLVGKDRAFSLDFFSVNRFFKNKSNRFNGVLFSGL